LLGRFAAAAFFAGVLMDFFGTGFIAIGRDSLMCNLCNESNRPSVGKPFRVTDLGHAA
jgi:hypothetical protein